MYRALYDFQSVHKRVLSFKKGDCFTILDVSNADWWKVETNRGEIGFVPVNYITKNEASTAEVLRSVDSAIDAVHQAAINAGRKYSQDQQDYLHLNGSHSDSSKLFIDPDYSQTPQADYSGQRFPDYTSNEPETSSHIDSIGYTPYDTERDLNSVESRKLLDYRRTVSQQIESANAYYGQQQVLTQSKSVEKTQRPPSGGDAFYSISPGNQTPKKRTNISRGPPPPPPVRESSSLTSSKTPTISLTTKNNTSQQTRHQPINANLSGKKMVPAYHTTPKDPKQWFDLKPYTPAMELKLRSFEAKMQAESMKEKDMVALSGLLAPHRDGSGSFVPDMLDRDLLEAVRINTSLSYELCKVAVMTVLKMISEQVPSVCPVMDQILKNMLIDRDDDNEEHSHDAKRMNVIFAELRSCKDDSQQRSWTLHEDESIIKEYLEELISILANANPKICQKVVAKDDYESVQALVNYYQMETRVSLRLLLLRVFGALCGLDRNIISMLLMSVLPLELARDMMTDTSNIQKLSYSALVCTMIFSTGESLPINHYEYFNEQFINYLLDNIEDPPPDDIEDQVPDLFVSLMLAFNLHYQMPQESLVMKVLADRRNAKVFTEKLMLLVNREDDPVQMFDFEQKVSNSVVKLIADIFAMDSTSELLYTNDSKVLVDIIIRQLSDLSPGNKMRTEYLSLMYSILKTPSYHEHKHRLSELTHCLHRIAKEEEPDSESDRFIVNEIWKDFPEFFR